MIDSNSRAIKALARYIALLEDDPRWLKKKVVDEVDISRASAAAINACDWWERQKVAEWRAADRITGHGFLRPSGHPRGELNARDIRHLFPTATHRSAAMLAEMRRGCCRWPGHTANTSGAVAAIASLPTMTGARPSGRAPSSASSADCGASTDTCPEAETAIPSDHSASSGPMPSRNQCHPPRCRRTGGSAASTSNSGPPLEESSTS
jgi:hypothetical protein